jgi:hypothetical protein
MLCFRYNLMGCWRENLILIFFFQKHIFRLILWRCSKESLIGALAAGSGSQGQYCHDINQIKKNEW